MTLRNTNPIRCYSSLKRRRKRGRTGYPRNRRQGLHQGNNAKDAVRLQEFGYTGKRRQEDNAFGRHVFVRKLRREQSRHRRPETVADNQNLVCGCTIFDKPVPGGSGIARNSRLGWCAGAVTKAAVVDCEDIGGEAGRECGVVLDTGRECAGCGITCMNEVQVKK